MVILCPTTDSRTLKEKRKDTRATRRALREADSIKRRKIDSGDLNFRS